ncbi:MAG: phosphocholine cytidylyltransferase family protein [Magnetococcales bacterium]|nr:phosphocholine cytidylyltransferase family protein [Magnetococcales bacterium]
MKAIILAAGRGSRLDSLTDERPKALVPFRGKPLIDWQLEALRGADVQEIAVVRGYLAERFELPLHYFENPRWAETNMVMSLVCAAPWLSEAPCLVSYADIVYSSDSVERLLKAGADIALTYDPNWLELWQSRFEDPLDDAETFKMDAQGRLLEIGQKPKNVDEVQGQYMGLLRFTPQGWRTVEDYLNRQDSATRDKLDMTGLLNRLLLQGVEIQAVPIQERWYEVDQETDLMVD